MSNKRIYTVCVRRTFDGTFTVEADSQADAERLAEQQLIAELPNVTWDEVDAEIMDVTLEHDDA